MAEVDYYEKMRQKLNTVKGFGAPKHKKIMEFLRIIWTEEEAKLLINLEGIGKFEGAGQIAKKAGMPEAKAEALLDAAAAKGTIVKFGGQYGLIPFVPGIFEFYYLKLGDTEENHKKAAKVLREIIDKVIPGMTANKKLGLLTPKLPIDAREKLIQINKSIEKNSEVLPHELVEEVINRNEYFTALPCQCRLIGEYAGEPCKLTKAGEFGCLACGMTAQALAAMGIGRSITKEEAIAHVRGAEKAGLIHNGPNTSGSQAYVLICNCCPCHCGLLSSTVKHGVPAGVTASNYRPVVNNELCTKCEICIKKCPMEAIFHRWPVNADSSDERIVPFLNKCMGCGVCASNCPENAILMEKFKFDMPPELSGANFNLVGPA